MLMLFIYVSLAITLFKLYQVLTCGQCKSYNKMIGKTVIVTGANSGIGFECACDLAWRGARVILACRNEARAENAKKKIIRLTGNQNIHVRLIDMTSLASVRTFAAGILNEEERLDVLVNNAGAAGLGNKMTEDGINIGMQVNHFGPFLLTNLLLPLLEKSAPSRVIFVSSVLHLLGKVDFSDIDLSNNCDDNKVYCNSKLYNIMTANELNRRMKEKGIIANSLHPGIVATNIFDNSIKSKTIYNITQFMLRNFFKSVEQGAQTMIHLAVSDETGRVGGKYYADCKPTWTLPSARNEDLMAQLWSVSEKMVGLNK